MKVLAFLFVILVLAQAESNFPDYITPGEIGEDNFVEEGSKIASGDKAVRGENLEFCYVTLSFINKNITCGCTLVDKGYVLTSGRCCIDRQEGKATASWITFPQFNKKPVKGAAYIVPDGSSGGGALPAYDNSTDIPFSTVVANNFCMIKLEKPFEASKIDDKKLAIPIYDTQSASPEHFFALYLNANRTLTLRVAGIGVTDNKGTIAKDVLVTSFDKAQNSEDCSMTTDGTTVTMPSTEDDWGACFSNPNSDANVCKYDWGGGVFGVQLDSKGKVIKGTKSILLAVLIGSPDLRPNAQCLGGHKNIAILVVPPVQTWIRNVINGVVAPTERILKKNSNWNNFETPY